MKELSLEEKAKAYDEALEVLKEKFADKEVCGLDKSVLQKLFPQLKESDDEKVRKHLISLFEKFVTLGVANECETSEIKVDDILAWLEKQGEQKPAWNDEDEEMHRKCICAMRASACGFPEEEKFVEQVDNWLKALKDRYTWKPSDEQMDMLKIAVSTSNSIVLDSLYNDLMKLKE